GARVRARPVHGARPVGPATRPSRRGGAAAAGVGAALGGDRQDVRVALPSRRRPRELPAGRPTDQLARRSGSRAPRVDRGRRLAHHPLRGPPLLRAPAHDPGRALRGGGGGRRGRRAGLHPHHLAAGPPDLAGGAALPDPRHAPGLRPDVRADRRRPGRQHRDSHGLRLPRALPDPAGGLRLRGRGGGVRARHGGGGRLSANDPPPGGGRVRGGRLRDGLVLAALILYALPFFWQVLTSVRPDAELLPLSHLLPSRLTAVHYEVVLRQSLMPRALLNSLGVALASTGLAVGLGALAAYALARLPVPGRGLILLGMIAATAFPQIATVSPLYLLVRALGLRDTWLALIL